MTIAPLKLWGHWGAPNPFKVRIVLETLTLPYETHLVEFSEVKQDSYLELNPNGRLPTLQDPNTGLTLFEASLKIHCSKQCLADTFTRNSFTDPIRSVRHHHPAPRGPV